MNNHGSNETSGILSRVVRVIPRCTIKICDESIGEASSRWNRTLLNTWDTIHPSVSRVSIDTIACVETTHWEFFCRRPCQCRAVPSGGPSIWLWTVTWIVSPLKVLVWCLWRQQEWDIPICFDQRTRELAIDDQNILWVPIRGFRFPLNGKIICSYDTRYDQLEWFSRIQLMHTRYWEGLEDSQQERRFNMGEDLELTG